MSVYRLFFHCCFYSENSPPTKRYSFADEIHWNLCRHNIIIFFYYSRESYNNLIILSLLRHSHQTRLFFKINTRRTPWVNFRHYFVVNLSLDAIWKRNPVLFIDKSTLCSIYEQHLSHSPAHTIRVDPNLSNGLYNYLTARFDTIGMQSIFYICIGIPIMM